MITSYDLLYFAECASHHPINQAGDLAGRYVTLVDSRENIAYIVSKLFIALYFVAFLLVSIDAGLRTHQWGMITGVTVFGMAVSALTLVFVSRYLNQPRELYAVSNTIDL